MSSTAAWQWCLLREAPHLSHCPQHLVQGAACESASVNVYWTELNIIVQPSWTCIPPLKWIGFHPDSNPDLILGLSMALLLHTPGLQPSLPSLLGALQEVPLTTLQAVICSHPSSLLLLLLHPYRENEAPSLILQMPGGWEGKEP